MPSIGSKLPSRSPGTGKYRGTTQIRVACISISRCPQAARCPSRTVGTRASDRYDRGPMSVKPSRLPVTVLTGFLGSGKTTLLNRILSEKHGKRIAVIENEFGEVGVDSELVIGAEEELFETNNGCICCTVRGDLIR